jgi:asparagine synthase (glutamine-hydrolysing)
VRRALETGEALPGTAGFAGEVDGTLVRDVLGRQPLFYEERSRDAESVDAADGRACINATDDWAFDPASLSAPIRLPAGYVHDDTELQRVWSLPDPAPATDQQEAVAAVCEAVDRSVRAVDADGLAVAFSGGVDSATVAAGVPEAPCYVVGFEGASDIERARSSADALGRDVRVVELTHDDIERTVPEVVAAIGRLEAMDVSIALTFFLVAERVVADGFDRLAVGQGVDELFGGYAKIAQPREHSHSDAETTRGARREALLNLPTQLERDVLAIRAAGAEPVAPLLHDRVIRAALPLPGALLATPDQRKIAFRRSTDELLPASIRRAEKNAAQYGSYVARELDRLARQAGFKRRMDDHVRKYVVSLVEDAGVDVPQIQRPLQ